MRTSLHAAELRLGRLQYQTVQRALQRAAALTATTVRVGDLDVPILRGGPVRGGPQRGGPASDTPLLLVHGFADRKESWLTVAPLLARGHQVVAPDLPGFGAAPAVPSARVSVRAQAAFLRDLLDALDLPRAHVVGQSMGGGIAARFAHDFPERVASLVLLAAAGPRGLHPHVLARVQAGNNPLIVRDLADFDVLMALALARPLPFPRTIRRFLAWQWGERRDELAGHFDRLMAPLPGEEVPERMRAMSVPAAVVYGRLERLVHFDNRDAYADGLPGCDMVMLDGVGHAPHLEAPLAVARVVARTVARAATRPGAR